MSNEPQYLTEAEINGEWLPVCLLDRAFNGEVRGLWPLHDMTPEKAVARARSLVGLDRRLRPAVFGDMPARAWIVGTHSEPRNFVWPITPSPRRDPPPPSSAP